jgi:hypothetical protein
MKKSRLILTATLLLILIVVSCNVLKKEDKDTDLRKFVSAFQTNLNLSDEEILKQFESKQSKESILSAIRVLQNKESAYIECTSDFQGFSVLGTDELVTLEIHSNFKSKKVEEEFSGESGFVMILKRKNNSYVIIELKAEDFYNAFADLRNRMQWTVEREDAIKFRRPIYAKAKELQQKFDSVIWFTTYDKVNYFYVVSGSWNFADFQGNKSTALMGVVDDAGNVITPVEYDFIGTIGFSEENIVEVGKNGKVGYFNIASRQLVIDPVYDLIIPYNERGVRAIVKQDSIYGWINNDRQFAAGFPSKEAEEWIRTYRFIPENLKISYEMQGICEAPAVAEIGRGCVMPSSYLVASGIFRRVVDGITTTKFPMQGWTEYVETQGSKLQSIGENLNALVTTLTERYLEGREEFYTENRLTFVNDKNDTLAVSTIHTGSGVEITRLNDSLIEVKSLDAGVLYGETYSEDNGGDIPSYMYFVIDGTSITPAQTERYFSASKFVKLDSSYLSGNFSWYNPQTQESEETTFLSLATVTYLRNEILAEYGYSFPTTEEAEKFKVRDIEPRYESIAEFRDAMSDIDKHNIDFLERMINRMQGTALQ